MRDHESVGGKASAIAFSVALRSSSAPRAPSAASTGAWSSSRSSRSKTPRQPFHGRQLLDEDLAAGERDRRHPEGDAREQHEALGHHAHHARDRPADRLAPVVVGVELADEQEDGDREDRPRDVAQDPVDAVHELRAGELEATGFGGEFPRVRVVADRGRLELSRSRHHEAARQHVVGDVLVDRVRLACEERLVDLERGRGAHGPVGGDLVAGAELDDVVEYHVVDPDLARFALAHDADLRCAEHGQLVESALGTQLLDNADERVADQDDAEQRVLRMAHGQDDHEQHAEDCVEPGEDVRPHDLAERAAGALGAGVRRSLCDALLDLGRGETGERCLVHRFGRHGLPRTRRCCHDWTSSRRACGSARSRRCRRPRAHGSRRARPSGRGRRRGRWR